uniref:Uncharacterized protein n=1 Tax=Tanacetum cinerariifolium TaxID=118510 RepID=A0A699RYQ0_TANCI|nr:hypothetical protein [Tanacetum cinerariifolium]
MGGVVAGGGAYFSGASPPGITSRQTTQRYMKQLLFIASLLLGAGAARSQTSQSDGLLLHEQGHYDMALLLAAIFKKQVGILVLRRGTYSQQVRELFAGILQEIKQLEVQYDVETEHRKNAAAQLVWDQKIALLLRAAAQ